MTPDQIAYRRQAIETIVLKMFEAQRVLDEAKQAGTLPVDVDTTSDSSSERQTLREKLRTIEDELIASQPADSDVGKALADFVSAKENLDAQTQRIVESKQYKQRIRQVRDAVNAGALRSAIRQEAFKNDRPYQSASEEYRYAKKHLDDLKAELFAQDDQWNAASRAIQDATERKKMGQVGEGVQTVALEEKQEKENPIAVAQATLIQGRSLLRQFGIKDVDAFLTECQRQKIGSTEKP
jgi:hypothetical protein